MKVFRLVILAAGIPLLGLLIYRIGPRAIWHEFTLLGWALAPLILLEGIAGLFHAQGFRHCFSASHKTLPFSRVFAILMAGSSINHLTPTAGLGGEVAKGLLLASNRTGAQAASAVLIDKLSSALSQLVLIVVGSAVLLPRVMAPRTLWAALIPVTVLIGSGIIGFLAAQRWGKLGGIIRWAVSHRLGGARLAGAANSLTELDEEIRRFHRKHPFEFISSIGWHLAGYAWGTVPTYYFLIVAADSGTLPIAGALTVLGIWFDLAAFAMPSDIGIQEATRVLAFRIVGYPSALGLTFGITRRLQQLFWAGVGLVLYGLLISTRADPHLSAPRAESAERTGEGEMRTLDGGSA